MTEVKECQCAGVDATLKPGGEVNTLPNKCEREDNWIAMDPSKIEEIKKFVEEDYKKRTGNNLMIESIKTTSKSPSGVIYYGLTFTANDGKEYRAQVKEEVNEELAKQLMCFQPIEVACY
ncbi:uncharacterized protein LOC113778168 [Coffea eugenioides]|uniref:uncharacterized protein LOC113778168 n=1 Tax=Coffea eugenioides TaxID=49369 RepID=UPI000F5C66C9|nr:uncharacterized protein LOC113702372 [Coffea arabica]XP_027179267.1 uncharacterized protein LOC113778168 [Coffea eugenioides]